MPKATNCIGMTREEAEAFALTYWAKAPEVDRAQVPLGKFLLDIFEQIYKPCSVHPDRYISRHWGQRRR